MSVTADRLYVERYFWTLEELAEAVGLSIRRVDALVAAGCAPGPVYVLSDNVWWSALSDSPAPDGLAWYSPGAAWGLRRAILANREGASDLDAATLLKREFCTEFVDALAKTKNAILAFPKCFSHGDIDAEAAYQTAELEWKAWLDGGYGVCLRIFTGHSCVAKEALGASIKATLDLEDHDPAVLLKRAEELAGIILPFAPWQRPSGTPGKTIDRLLAQQKLGCERPYQ